MTAFKARLTQATVDLNAVYGQVKADARKRLGKLYNPDDYPGSILGLFGMEWDFPSVEPPNYLMQLSPELYAQEQERVTRRFEQAVELAEQAFISEFAKVVAHLTERLSAGAEGERKVFRDTAVANLRAFFERFKQLNVGSSAQLDELVAQAQRVVAGAGPQQLRDNQELRQQVATQLAAVQSVLDGMLVDQPRRRLVRSRRQEGGEG